MRTDSTQHYERGGQALVLATRLVACLLVSAYGAMAQEPPANQMHLKKDIPEEDIAPGELFPLEFRDEAAKQFDRDLASFKPKAMRATFYAGEFTNPMRAFDDSTPEDRFPERHGEFEKWIEHGLVDGLLRAVERHLNTQDLVDAVILFFHMDAMEATTEWGPGSDFAFEAFTDDDQMAMRAPNLRMVKGVTERVLGEGCQASSRVKWLDYHGGVGDLVRWEGRVQNIHLFESKVLAVDLAKVEFTYESAKVSVYKTQPFGVPVLVQLKFEADPKGTKWGLIFTKEKRAGRPKAETSLNSQSQSAPPAPLVWKLDFGVIGDDRSHEAGLVFSARF